MANDASGAIAAGASDPIAAAHAALLRNTGLQFEFEAAPPPPRMPEWLRAFLEFLGLLQPVFEFLFWAGVAAILLLIVYFAAREWLRYRGRKVAETGSDTPLPDWRPTAERARALLSDADQLAAEGRFAEAVHLLLFRSLDDLETLRPHLLKPAFTSRDIVMLRALPAAAARALGRLVAAVEWSFFGGRPVGVTDFAECRRAYEEFAFSDNWREKAA
jgi:hypothetical protein